MMHPHAELRLADDAIGLGVFATRRIPRGTLTWTLCELDRAFDPAAVAALPAELRRVLARYSYIDNDGRAVLCWDFGRYVNHSCEPTSLGLGPFSEIAVRDVEAGEQLTSEYGALNMTADLDCRCGAPSCRGVIRGADALRHGDAWDARVRDVLPWAADVTQPLLEFVRDRAWHEAVLAGRVAPPSHRDAYFRPPAVALRRDAGAGLWHFADQP